MLKRSLQVGDIYEDVVSAGVVWSPVVIAENDLRAWIIRVSSVAQEFSDILNILVASIQLMLSARIVDANQQGLLPIHDGRRDELEHLRLMAFNLIGKYPTVAKTCDSGFRFRGCRKQVRRDNRHD